MTVTCIWRTDSKFALQPPPMGAPILLQCTVNGREGAEAQGETWSWWDSFAARIPFKELQEGSNAALYYSRGLNMVERRRSSSSSRSQVREAELLIDSSCHHEWPECIAQSPQIDELDKLGAAS
jgi:hypothetical protein